MHSLEVTEGLRERGHEVRWLATSSPDNVESAGEFVPLIVDGEGREGLRPSERVRAARQAVWNPEAASAMHRLLADFSPDVLHVHKAYVQLSVAPLVVASRYGVPIVQTAHDYEFISASAFDSNGGRWDRQETRPSYRFLNSSTFVVRRTVHRPRVSRWIAVSRELARRYEEIGGITCDVLPNFTRSSVLPPVAFEDRRGVAFVGRLSPEKGVRSVLEVVRQAPDLDFIVAGDGPLQAEVSRAASELPNLEYRGRVEPEEGRRLLGRARLCLMPSSWDEPGPLVGLEAMAEGTPVICHRKGGLAEYVAASDAGCFSQTLDSSGLLEAIRSTYSNRSVWTGYSERARAGSARNHSRAAYVEAIERIYAAAIAG